MTKLNGDDFPVIYYQISEKFNKAIYAIVLRQADSWDIYTLNGKKSDEDARGSYSQGMLLDTDVAMALLPSSSQATFRKHSQVITKASDQEISSILEQIRSVFGDTWDDL